MRKITIASRKSDLARIQAQSVAEALQKIYPDLEVELGYRESLGDKNQNDPLWKMPEKGVFTQDFREDLMSERIDVVVHSWKDLPTDMGSETRTIGAMSRADQRDLLLVKKCSIGCGTKSKLKLLSSSPRRSHNLSQILPDLLPAILVTDGVEFADIRGNVPTRIKKCLEDETADGLILAKAGIDRLLSAPGEEFADMRRALRESLAQFRWAALPLSINPTAAAQGALALEIKVGRPELEALLAPLVCARTTAQVQIERLILKSYGGGCHQKIGISIIDHPLGALVSLRGKTDDGTILNTNDILVDYLRNERADLYAQTTSLLARLHQTSMCALGWSAETKFDAKQMHAVQAESFFPRHKQESLKVFARRGLPLCLERLRHQPILVARANALPEKYQAGADQLLWTAGVETWKALARRGYWVSGTSDSLGQRFEQTARRLSPLAPEAADQLVNLTHNLGTTARGSLATYALTPLPTARMPHPTPEWFYWMSGSAFLWALAQDPSIVKSLHSCGPGNTLETIIQHIPQANVRVYPSYEIWLKQIERAARGRNET